MIPLRPLRLSSAARRLACISATSRLDSVSRFAAVYGPCVVPALSRRGSSNFGRALGGRSDEARCRVTPRGSRRGPIAPRTRRASPAGSRRRRPEVLFGELGIRPQAAGSGAPPSPHAADRVASSRPMAVARPGATTPLRSPEIRCRRRAASVAAKSTPSQRAPATNRGRWSSRDEHIVATPRSRSRTPVARE